MLASSGSEKTQLPLLVPLLEETGTNEVPSMRSLADFPSIVLCVSKNTLQIDSGETWRSFLIVHLYNAFEDNLV
jgi:hypothetical protein